MAIDIVVPQLGESITEATVSSWLKSVGDTVAEGDILVELETDKVMVEVPAEKGGLLEEQLKNEGAIVQVGDVLARINPADGSKSKTDPTKAGKAQPASTQDATTRSEGAPAPKTAAVTHAESPAVRRMAVEHTVDTSVVQGTGRDGRVTKGDMVEHVATRDSTSASPAAPTVRQSSAPQRPASTGPKEGQERVRMSRLRQRIAERLLAAQQNAAILTTFNEVDMTEVMALRNRYKEQFRAKYGIAIGFMSFFTKACIEALRTFRAVNGEIDGEDIVYKNYYHISVAVGTERGLVVPVVRHADSLRFIEIEQEIARLAGLARDNKLSVDDLSGGTFTISNGGIYGSLMSTPILNPPQSGILGMHKIQDRAVVVNGEVKVRPMMHIALSYDHRIIDGREAVQFLIKVKECIEDPARMLLEI